MFDLTVGLCPGHWAGQVQCEAITVDDVTISSSTYLNTKQLLDEVFVIPGIIKVEVSSASADNTNRDLDYSGYHKNRI